MTNMSNFCGGGDINKIYVIGSGSGSGTDYYVTGGTYSNGVLTLNLQNGSVIITGFTSNDTFVTGFTFNVGNYDLTILQNNGLPPLVQNLGILAGDITVTGGTYNSSNGVATFYNNAGGSFQVSGFLTGFTDIKVSDLTYNGNVLVLTQTDGTTFSATTPTFTGNTSATCITDLYVNNLNSCSPLYIQPTNTGNVLIGSGGGVNVGIGVNSPTSKLHIVGIDSSSSNFGLKVQSSGGTNNLSVRNDGKVNIGTNTVYGEAKLMIKTDDTTSLLKLETSSYPYTAGEINFNGIGVALGGGSSYNITGGNYARGLALGFLASTNTEEAGMAVGHYSSANSIFRDAIAIGVSAKADGAYATAIGNLVSATTQSIMIGLGLPFNGGNLITNNVSNSIAFGLNSDTPTMWVTGGNNTPGSNGNVGINSKNPQAKLEIKGFDASSSNFGLKVQSSGGTNNLSVKNNGLVEGGGPGSLTSVASNYFQLGSATPYIEGDVTVGRLNRDSNTTFTIYGANYPQLKFDSVYSTKITLTSGFGGGYLLLRSNSTANNTLLSPNFVGVNLTGETINSALEVNGKTSTTTLQVTSGATAGYVLTALDSNGNASWQPATGGGSGTTIIQQFTGNTSASCITDLYVDNLFGCSPITIHDSIQSNGSTASGLNSFAFGDTVMALGDYSHAEGNFTKTGVNSAFSADSVNSGLIILNSSYGDVTGYFFQDNLLYLYTPGPSYSIFTISAVTFNSPFTEIQLYNTSFSASNAYVGDLSYLNGNNTFGGDQIIPGNYSHAEGSSLSLGTTSHAEGSGTQAVGASSHTEGFSTRAYGLYSHAEGSTTITLGQSSHAEGDGTQAKGDNSHAEGSGTQAVGEASHAEGKDTIATGGGSHTEGNQTQAIGNYSHTEGLGTIAYGDLQHVSGQYNLTATTQSAFIIGNGTNSSNRSNLLFAAGNEVNISGKVVTTTLQVTSGSTTGYVLTAIDSNGNASWQPATGGGGTLSGDTYVTGGTYSNGTLILERQNGSVAITGFNQYFISGSTPTGVTINYGDRWYNTNNGIELVYITDGTSDQWVQPLNTPGPPGYSNLMVTSSITTSAATLNININYYGVVHTGNVDISLPNPSGYDGYNINIKDESGNASIYRIRLTPLSGLIDGNNYVDMNTNYMSLHIVARNNNWWII